MRFALVNNERTEAKHKLNGICPACYQPVIPKCGTLKIHHWAHSSKKSCDSWWETETEWHRTWKNNFPEDWQEFVLFDENTGEKHIADVRNKYGLVVEFQHSYLDVQERISRENFYKNMVWVVDGTRLKGDYPRFVKERKYFKQIEKNCYFFVNHPEKCFPVAWTESSVPVIFDFQETILVESALQNNLWCLLVGRNDGRAVVVAIPHKSFIYAANVCSSLLPDCNTVLARMQSCREQLEQERLQNEQIRKECELAYRMRKGYNKHKHRW